MNFRSLCTSHALGALLGAVALIFHPRLLFDLLALPGDALDMVGRLAGALLLNVGVTLWFLRNTHDRGLQRQIVLGNIVCDVILATVFLWTAVVGGSNDWGYAFGALYVVNLASWVVALRRHVAECITVL